MTRKGTDAVTGHGGRWQAIGLALFVTFLWSTSWILIRIGLDDFELRPLSFAGLRYALAALILLPLASLGLRRSRGLRAPSGLLAGVVVLGVLLYGVAQGAAFAALDLLPAATVGLVLSLSPVVVAFISILVGRERPLWLQGLGIVLLATGATLYFGVAAPPVEAVPGLAVGGVGLIATAVSAVLGRQLVRDAADRVGGVVSMTALTMAVGGFLLLGVGLAVEGVPRLPPEAWLVVGWLALVNTAFAFTVWNHTLRRLTAVESSVLNNTMLVQVAALAWLVLGEALEARQVLGIATVVVGVAIVQVAPFVPSRRGAERGSDFAPAAPDAPVPSGMEPEAVTGEPPGAAAPARRA